MESIVNVSDAQVLKDNETAIVISKKCNQSVVYAIIDGNPYSKILNTADTEEIKNHLKKADYPENVKYYNLNDDSLCFVSAYSISSIGVCVQEKQEKFCAPELVKSYVYISGFKPEFYQQTKKENKLI